MHRISILTSSFGTTCGRAASPRNRSTLKDRVETDLAQIKRSPRLVRSFFRAERVGYIMDYAVINDLLAPLKL
jgi:hypothetical protein